MKGKDPNDPNHPYNRGYKSVMDDPHYDPEDPYYRRDLESKNGQMTHANRMAMYKVLFKDFATVVNGRAVCIKPSSLCNSTSDDQGGEGILASWDNGVADSSGNAVEGSNYVNRFRDTIQQAFHYQVNEDEDTLTGKSVDNNDV